MSGDYQAARALMAPDKIGFVVQVEPRRIGALMFLTLLEYRHFPPLPKNDDFQMALLKWQEMRWALAVIPADKRHLAEGLLPALGLRIADGVPHAFSSAGVEVFPVNGKNVFTIEHTARHFAYSHDPREAAIALLAEDSAIEREQAAMMNRWRKINVPEKLHQ